MILLNGEEVLFEKFPNGETRLVNTTGILGTSWALKTLSFKYEDDSDLIKLMLLKNYLDSHNRSVWELVIYYMPYSRMDRSEEGSPFTLKYVANFINSLNFKRVRVIEPHSDVTCALLDYAKPVYINYDLLPRVADSIGFDKAHDYIVFPDAGASKRYSKMTGYHVLIGNKKRDFATGEIKGLDIIGDFNGTGKKAIIVDDLSSYGGTFVHTSKALKQRGIEQVYLLVAHAENSIFKKDLFKHVTGVFTSDSLITGHNYWENKKFPLVVYKLEELL